MHAHKNPNVVHDLAYCATCKRVTAQDVHFDLEEKQHHVCCSCGGVTHTQTRPK